MRHSFIVSLFFVLTAGCTSSPKASPPPVAPPVPASFPATIEDAVNSTSFRSEANRPRDVYRHPVETLRFFGIEPTMTVLEVSPGAGWYQEILAPLVVEHGHYIAAVPPPPADGRAAEGASPLQTWQKSHPEIAAKITTIGFNPKLQTTMVPPGSVDLILTFRNVHNWMMGGFEHEAFKAFFAALKPGGVLGVVEHRANPKGKRDLKGKSGYVLEKGVIAMATKAGFKLVAKSEINANPKDLKNYPEGVWTLPPVLRLKDKDRERYLAIGESDRMTLRFVKPVK